MNDNSTPPTDYKSVFIIMPFTKMTFTDKDNKTHIFDKSQLDYLYKNFIKTAAESYKNNNVSITAKRYEDSTGNFMKGIVNDIHNADIVIAEITDMNPNVMYELGVRHTLKNNTIMIAQDVSQIPSDLIAYLAPTYKFSTDVGECTRLYREFEEILHKAIKERLDKWASSDNPVRDFLEIKKEFKDEERIKEIEGNLNILNVFTTNLAHSCSEINIAISEWQKDNYVPSPSIDTSWESYYIQLLKNGKDYRVGIHIWILTRQLTVLQNNIGVYKNCFFTKTHLENIESIPLTLNDSSGKSYKITDLKDINNPVVQDLVKIKQNWEEELKRLQS